MPRRTNGTRVTPGPARLRIADQHAVLQLDAVADQRRGSQRGVGAYQHVVADVAVASDVTWSGKHRAGFDHRAAFDAHRSAEGHVALDDRIARDLRLLPGVH